MTAHRYGLFDGMYVSECPTKTNARGEHLLALVDGEPRTISLKQRDISPGRGTILIAAAAAIARAHLRRSGPNVAHEKAPTARASMATSTSDSRTTIRS